VIIRPNGGLFSELRNSGTPLRKLGGFSGTQGYLALLFATGVAMGGKRKKTSNTAKILGLQGVKVVSAEGIEPSTY